jgi:hypothetical protein
MMNLRRRARKSPVLIVSVLIFCLRIDVEAFNWEEFPMSGSPHLVAALIESSGIAGKPAGFQLRSGQETGINFTNVLTDSRIMVNLNLMNGFRAISSERMILIFAMAGFIFS